MLGPQITRLIVFEDSAIQRPYERQYYGTHRPNLRLS